MKGLYVHIPFCLKKCKYCDFNSFCGSEEQKKRYLKALFAEMDGYKDEQFDTVFVGGGTPTVLSTDDMEVLLRKITATFQVSANAEFTVEANPKTIDEYKLEVLLENGVNRLSLGVQSFCDNELKVIGRVHTAEDAIESFRLARSAGFKNISIDLMSAIPEQTTESFAENIRMAVGLEPEHISCYSLILEEGTALCDEYKKGLLTLPDEDTERSMYDYAVSELEKNGYRRYEVSNFARKGAESRHNIKYWQCREYIGVGLSAHSYTDGMRYSDTDSFSDYIRGNFRSGDKTVLTTADKMSEFMFMGLRMTDGVSIEDFSARFGQDLKKIFAEPLLKFEKMGMLKEENGRIFLEKNAFGVSNQIMCEFIL